jgi:hypothetical protein
MFAVAQQNEDGRALTAANKISTLTAQINAPPRTVTSRAEIHAAFKRHKNGGPRNRDFYPDDQRPNTEGNGWQIRRDLGKGRKAVEARYRHLERW